MADGKVIIDTELDNSGFKQGLSGLKSQCNGLKSVISSIGKTVAVAFSVVAIINFGRESVKAASDLSNAMLGLQSIMDGQGRSFSQAQSFIEDYIKDGLVPMQDAVTAYKNLAMRGYDTTQIEQTMTALKDAATFGRQSSLTMGQAISSATEGLKNENSILVDNAGVTKNVSVMWKEYAQSIGVGVQSLTKEQKIQAEVNGILQETKFQTGDAAKAVNTYAGQMSMLSFNFQQLKVAVGNAIIPVVQAVLPAINTIISALTSVANLIAQITTALFGKSTKSAQKAATATNSAANAQNNLADSTEKANKATDKQLASFDELNILKKDSAGSSSGESSGSTESGGGAVAEIPVLAGEIGSEVTVSPKVQQAVDFIRGLFENLNKALEPTKQALQGLWAELEKLGGFTWQALQDFYTNFLQPVGEWVLGTGLPKFIEIVRDGLSQINWENFNTALNNLWKALTPFAINVGEGLLWFIDNVLKPLGVWVANEAVPAFLDVLAKAIEALNSIIEALKPLGIWLFDNFLRPIAEWTGGLIVTILNNIADALGEVSHWINNNQSVVQGMTVTIGLFFAAWKVTELLSFIQQSGGVIAAIRAMTTAIAGGTLAKIKDKAETVALTAIYAKEFIVNMAQGTAALVKQAAQWVATTAAKVADTTATVAHTAASWAASAATTAFGVAMNILTSPITLVILAIAALIAIVVLLVQNWDTVKAAATACWEKIKEVWNIVANWFKENVIQPVVVLFTNLWNSITSAASNAWNSIKQVFQTVATWYYNNVILPVQNFFKGLWDKISGFASDAWNNIKKTFQNVASWFDEHIIQPVSNGFKGFINNLLSGVENFVNFFIQGINKIIDALNGLSLDVPGFLGGGHIGFDISPISPIQLPRLAQGAVIPPNREFMAVLGDQKSGTNIEAPLSTIEQAVESVLQRNGMMKPQEITLRLVSDRGFVRHLKVELDKESQRKGVKLVKGGVY